MKSAFKTVKKSQFDEIKGVSYKIQENLLFRRENSMEGINHTPSAFKDVVCKECGKFFRCPIIHAIRRGGKTVAVQKTFWCSRICSTAYNRRVRK